MSKWKNSGALNVDDEGGLLIFACDDCCGLKPRQRWNEKLKLGLREYEQIFILISKGSVNWVRRYGRTSERPYSH